MSNDPPSPPDAPRHADGAFVVEASHGLDSLVALQVRCGANRIEDSFPLDLRLEVDEWRVRVERRTGLLHRLADHIMGQPATEPPAIELRVRLRHCYVRYRCDGVGIAADSKYRSAVAIGAYSDTQAVSDRTAAGRVRTAHFDGSVRLGAASDASVAGGYRVGSNWQGSSTVERTITASQDLYEVEAVPGGWRVGDRTHGDPLKRDGCLDGPYFARAVDGRPHSCTVEFLPGRDRGSLRFAVTTRDGLFVETVDGAAATPFDHGAAVAAMRDRLAAICIEQAFIGDGEDEMTLSEIRATCAAANDADSPAGSMEDRRDHP